MKKGRMVFSFLALLLFLLVGSVFVLAVDCPFGLINDTYPGDCARYIDTNGDGICDLSQDIQPTQTTTENTSTNIFSEKYPFISVILVSLIFYFTTFILSKKGKISVLTHRRIWNILLLISFIWCALTSIIFILNLNYGLTLGQMQTLTFWHIETGIVMIIHIIWHTSYYKNIFKS